MQLMAEKQWAQAARLLRKLSTGTNRGDLWMQYGHALKEAGMLSEAGVAYERAHRVLGPMHDVLMQLGHWNKVAGNFREAEEYYQMAKADTGDNGAARDVDRMIAPLARFRPLPPPPATDDPHLFFSCASKLEPLSDVSITPHELGRANYSYSFAMRGFQRAADQLNFTWSFLTAPQYISHASMRTPSRNPIHLAFYPPGLCRLMKGACNVLVFAWEFPVLPVADNWAHAFSEPSFMLDRFDEIWLPSQYAVDVIGRYTQRPVRRIPSPISTALDGAPQQATRVMSRRAALKKLARVDWVPLSIFARLQANFNEHAISRRRKLRDIVPDEGHPQPVKIFLSVFNPHDRRKQLLPLIQGFLEIARTESDAILLLKTASPDDTNATINQRLLTHQIASPDALALPLASERVWLTNAALTEAELTALYDLTAFYICTSYCEGQNLALLEAMGRAVVPISPRHTAMADYLHDDNSIIIQHTVEKAPMLLQQTYRVWDTDTHVVTSTEVSKALRAACRLEPKEVQMKAEEAVATIRQQYNFETFSQAISGLVGQNTQGREVVT